MSSNKREFEQLPDWLQECWNLSPAIARKAEKYIDSIEPLSSHAVLDDVREALIELRDFGFDNPGRGYSCAKKAEEILNIIRAHIV